MLFWLLTTVTSVGLRDEWWTQGEVEELYCRQQPPKKHCLKASGRDMAGSDWLRAGGKKKSYATSTAAQNAREK
ncbi:unnamed protein product [Toxocara canis]|uniref:Secreted protein n=1 Tax=Toxocara canis TaxID=6265 RepID=A0A183VH16_TOXCA|nr:unnamed protein product [Toxocara canis]